MPQFLAVVQGYRPLDGEADGLGGDPQLLAAAGLVAHASSGCAGRHGFRPAALCMGTALVFDGTAALRRRAVRPTLVLFSVGQLLFLAPAVVVGATSLKPADLPTASLAFNMTTIGGTTLGVGLASNFVTERQKFHSNVITENISLYSALDTDRPLSPELLRLDGCDGTGGRARVRREARSMGPGVQ